MPPSVLLLEFNELTPRLMDQFIDRQLLPNFRRFKDESRVFVTDAGERQENLEPWIQWVTVHSGLSYEEHGVFHLDDAEKLRQPCLWDLVSAAGKTVWVCGSMNVRYRRPIHGWVLPDPWASGEACPPELNSFFDFVRSQVQEHSNQRAPLSIGAVLRFLAFLATHGLTAATVSAVAKQLLAERRSDCRWKRATLLDRMQWDLFRHYFRKARPAFSTFFLNSTAHFQHCFWRNMEPEQFRIRPTDAEQQIHGGAIQFGYQEMDRIVGQALELAGDDTVVMLATALSQQPYLKMEDAGGKQLYRPENLHAFPGLIGLGGVTEVAPVMAEQFYIYHDGEASAVKSQEVLQRLRCDGNPVFVAVEREGARLLAGCGIFRAIPDDATIELPGGGALRFFDAFYPIKESLKSGMHHPDGMLWVRLPDRRHYEEQDKIPLTAVAPTILKVLGLPVPPYMRAEPLALAESVQPAVS